LQWWRRKLKAWRPIEAGDGTGTDNSGDIQKATGKTVLAAEQVSKAVEGGVKQTAESGASIRKMAESISEAAQAAEQIACPASSS